MLMPKEFDSPRKPIRPLSFQKLMSEPRRLDASIAKHTVNMRRAISASEGGARNQNTNSNR